MQKLLHPSRRAIAALAIPAAAIPFALYVREATPLVLTVLVQELLVQASYLSVCLLIGRPILRWLLPEKTDTILGVVSAIAFGLGIIGFATFAFGHAGLLSQTTAWGIIIGAAAIGLIDSKHFLASLTSGSQRFGKWFKEQSPGGLLWLVVALLFAIPLIGATLPAGMLWRPDDPHPYDSLIYHLQVPREWFELGRIVPLEHNVYSYFPFNVELHYLLASYLRGSPWLAATQNQFLSISFTLLTATALRGWLRTRVDARSASLATAAFLAVPWVLMSSCVTYVEAGMLLYAILAIVWCLEALTQTNRPYQSFIIAGIFAGLVSGIKLTGAAMILAAIPACALVCFALPALRTGRLKQLLLGCILFGIAGTAALSPWLIRNQIWAGNPVFPNAMHQLGQAHFADVQVERWERAHRPAADHASLPARLHRLTDQIAINWRYSYIFFPLAIIAALYAWRKPEAQMLLLLLVIMLIFWLVATHLMGRFFVLALVPGAILIALLPRRSFYPTAALVAASGIFVWIGPTFPAPQMAGTRNLDSLFAFYAEFGRNGAYGLQDYKIFDEKLQAKMESAKEIVFVGDGQMFQRQFPMDKIHYRTVFDLNQDGGGRNIVDTYYGPSPQLCPKDALIIADPGEANRLANTYYAVPSFDPAALKDYPNTVTIEP